MLPRLQQFLVDHPQVIAPAAWHHRRHAVDGDRKVGPARQGDGRVDLADDAVAGCLGLGLLGATRRFRVLVCRVALCLDLVIQQRAHAALVVIVRGLQQRGGFPGAVVAQQREALAAQGRPEQVAQRLVVEQYRIRQQGDARDQKRHQIAEHDLAQQRRPVEGEEGADLEELDRKIKAAGMSREGLAKALGEIKKLRLMSPMSAEATVVRNYIDTLVALPWSKKTKIKHDLANAEAVLNEDHYGLEKVKDRILEYLAVQQRVDKVKAPILCLVGPPGVGKTSLGQSIAKATNRKFVRMALGGVRDEAEIRGHRRTYIGSMPGKILQSLTKVGVRNPLFLLDEAEQWKRTGREWITHRVDFRGRVRQPERLDRRGELFRAGSAGGRSLGLCADLVDDEHRAGQGREHAIGVRHADIDASCGSLWFEPRRAKV